MPRRLATVQDHVDDIFKARAELAKAKFNALPLDVERPSGILSSVFGTLKEHLDHHGFSFNKGKRTFRRKVGSFEHLITTQADSNNYAGIRAAFWVHVSVVSQDLKAWRSAHNIHASEYVFSKTLADKSGSGQLVWDFINPELRAEELVDLLYVLETIALPTFQPWTSAESASLAISCTDSINRLDNQAEIALWLGNRAAAIEILQRAPDRQSVADGLRELSAKFDLGPVV